MEHRPHRKSAASVRAGARHTLMTTVSLVTRTVSAAQARRVFLNAQGLARKRPPRGPRRDRDFAAYLHTQGVLQLDTVNVLARAHYMPLFSRFGAFDLARADAFLWGDARGHSAHAFEHWGHEASVMPRELLPAMHHRMVGIASWQTRFKERLDRERPGLIDAAREAGPARPARWWAPTSRTSPRARAARDRGGTTTTPRMPSSTSSSPARSPRRGAATSRAPTTRRERAWGLPPADAVGAERLPPVGAPCGRRPTATLRPRARRVRHRHRGGPVRPLPPAPQARQARPPTPREARRGRHRPWSAGSPNGSRSRGGRLPR